MRTVETRDGHEVRGFEVFGPIAIAAIGKLPGTIEDRSIKVAMRRRRPDETVARVRLDRLDALVPLARRAARWARDHIDALRTADPDVPAELHDRAADNWRSLLAIADEAGGGWPERARRAAVALTAAGADDAETMCTMLLADLHELFNAEPSGVLFTAEILAALHKRDDRPWPEYRHGKPITGRQVASLIKEVGVPTNKTVRRPGAKTDKGYRVEWFVDAFMRYLSPRQSITRSQRKDSAAFSDPDRSHAADPVTDASLQNSNVSGGCDRVTDLRPLPLANCEDGAQPHRNLLADAAARG
jgi:putative DNA primase/helicase